MLDLLKIYPAFSRTIFLKLSVYGGVTMPRSVIIAEIRRAGVISKAGFLALEVGGEIG